MQSLLLVALTGERALREAPLLLVARVENIYVEGDEEFFVDARADWSQTTAGLDLGPCFTSEAGVYSCITHFLVEFTCSEIRFQSSAGCLEIRLHFTTSSFQTWFQLTTSSVMDLYVFARVCQPGQ